MPTPKESLPIARVNEDGWPAMMLEDVAGESLATILHQRRLDVAACLRLGSQLAQIVGALHAAHRIHRDLRPANFMLDTQQQLRLLDLSVAAVETQDAAVPGNDLPGDWAYASPEQTGRMHRPLDCRTDFYSLGIMLYRMLTGQLPFAAGDVLEWTHCHIARSPSPLQTIAPEIPQVVSAIVMRLLAKLPEERYQSAHGLHTDLERCLAQWQATGRIESFLLGTEDVSERFHIPHKLYGRDPERATLLEAFNRMAASGAPALVTVAGYSGIGKSSLVYELQRPIVEQRGYFIAGKFDQYQRDIPYATITQAFRELVQQLLAESEARIADWRQQIQAAVGVNGQLIVDVLPQVELIIGPQAPVAALPPTEAQHRFRRVFRQFMAVFTRREHPLVLFLDDLQWVDAASLALIEHLLTDPETRYLLLIGAYRDNEVGAAHPLNTGLAAIRHSGATLLDIRLAPLAVEHLNRLVADTLHAPFASCEPLTRLMWERTEGNPFFFIQFLEALHQEGLLRQDAQYRAWQWDLAQIEAQDFADNVVDLMLHRLWQLPQPVQQALQLAACLGNKFDLRHLALVSGQAEVKQSLTAALQESVIVCSNGSGKFLHDRIQQAAYCLIPEEDRAEVHLRIGRVLRVNLTADELAEHVFDVANQFNRGAALLAEPDEKAQVAQINLHAGRRAKASVAYASASVYLAAGMALLDESDWSGRYELLFSLWLERAECEFLTGRFDQAEQLIEVLLRCAASKVDQAAVYHLKVQLHVVKSEYAQAVDSVLTCLRLFDIDLPAHPTREQVQVENETVWRNLEGRSIEDLIDLPLMTDPELHAAMGLLSILSVPASLTDNHLYCLHLCRMVNVSLEHGMSGASAHACGRFVFILGPLFQRYREGFSFAKLACNLVEKHGFITYQSKVYILMGRVAFWTQPITTAIDFVRTSLRTALETGDRTYACYAMYHIVTLLLLRNDSLDAVWRESEIALDFVRKAGFRDITDIIVPQQRFIATLQGRTASVSTFGDAQFDEAAFEAQLTSDRMSIMICFYWILKLKARFLSGDYAEALAAADKAKVLLWLPTAHFALLDYYYYAALTIAALYENASADERPRWGELLELRDQLREWADNYPPTFRDKHALVSAEIARIEGRGPDAMRLYEEAIQSARENGFVQNEAIAYECASAFYRTCGVDSIADMYLRQACDCFARWGADGKVRQLDERISQLQAQQPVGALLKRMDEAAQLDLLSVAKASQAISGQIVLDELVDTLMRIVLENAGAQIGYLLLVRNDSLVLAAEARVEQQTVHVQLQREPASPESCLPAAILNYVRRSREPVLLADMAQLNPFAGDAYFAHRQPKSVLCLPILRQETLLGMLYLENSLVTQVFTPERVTVLQLLASQAAISLENALLYADLREREARIQRLVDSNIIGIFIGDIEGNITEANDALLQIIGYSRQELLSGNVQWSSMTPVEYRAANARVIEELVRIGSYTPYEKEYIRKDGSRVPVLVGAARFEGSQQAVAFVLDLTERKQAEAALRKAHEELEGRVLERTRELQQSNLQLVSEVTERLRTEVVLAQRSQELARSNKELEQMAYVASHDLQEPLRMVVSYMQLLERKYRDQLDADAHEFIGFAVDGAKRMQALIDGLLSYSRVDSGATPLQPTDCNAVVANVLCSLRLGLEESGVQVECGVLPVVMGDATQLTQMFLNLMCNAIKFRSGQAPRIAIRAEPKDGFWRFAVQDNGIGIAPEYFERIFVMFQRLHSRSRYPGTGIGLAICKKIVERHGGCMWVESAPQQGATFLFTLQRETGGNQ